MKERKKTFNLQLLKRLFSFAQPYRRTVVFAVTMSVILAGLGVVRPYLIQISVDRYIANKDWPGLVMISGLQLAALLTETGFRFWFLFRINWLGQTVVNDLRKTVFEKIIFQNISYYDKTPIGTLTTRTINDIESINDVFSEGIISILADLLTIVAIITIMLFTEWRLTLVCLTTFPAILVATYFFKESVNKSFQRVRNAVAALNAFVQEHIVGMYIVQAFAAEKREMGKFKEINKEHRNANIKAIFAYSVFFPVVEIILAISMGLLVWWGAVRLLHSGVTTGVIIAFIMYLNALFRPLRMLADKFNVLQMGMVAAERVFNVLDSHETLKRNGNYAPAHIAGNLTFKDVHFAYKHDVPVLRGISFDVPAGTTTAVVGHTGAGKTSIISLINRMYEIQSGSILIDGHSLNEYDIYELRKHIGIVLQDVFLFSGTVYENITLRNNTIPLSEVMDVCKMLGIHPFVMQLPGNYEFNIMERGGTLSQGQRQLISFARALLYKPAILILDEATSSVDSESEQLIQKAIDTLTTGRTSIVIAHRLSTIKKAEQILVMDKGLIIERGTHKQLIAEEGPYYKLYTAVEKELVL